MIDARAYVFDAYGTLFDVHAAIGRHRATANSDADRSGARSRWLNQASRPGKQARPR
jgi:FMN phosphatase YigB (HAD superfamily)